MYCLKNYICNTMQFILLWSSLPAQQQPGLGVGTRNSTMQLKQEFHRNAEKLQKIWECGLRDTAVAAGDVN